MPHLVLSGPTALETAARRIEKNPRRWGRAVIKTEDWWTRSDGRALLVEGVVVEFSRALRLRSSLSIMTIPAYGSGPTRESNGPRRSSGGWL